MTRRVASPRRAAFTLVEILIVVVIIALLAALLLAAIQRVTKVGATATAVNDISNLNVACESFKREFGFFPPSTFTVPTKVTDPGFLVLKQMYPRWNPATDASGNLTAPLFMPGNTTLDGNQSMVLFLGGPIQTGWATDGPFIPTASATAIKGPYFDFKQDRLAPGNTFGSPSVAPAFLDPFKTPAAPNGSPFVYFGSNVPGGKYSATTMTVNGVTVFPFVEQASGATVVKYVNQGGVQIVSAGEDSVFGPGCPPVGTTQCKYVAGSSNAAGGISPYGEGDAGANDLANFNNGNKLGVGK